MIRVALTGLPGAGKSTTAGLLKIALEKAGVTAGIVKMAAPLYDVQNFFYDRCGQSVGEGRQDGKFLNFLGSHFRDAAPDFLVRDLTMRCEAVSLIGVKAIICDDARPVDLRQLRSEGFELVGLEAPDEIRRARKANRGDRFQGNDSHSTEQAPPGGVVVVDRTVHNGGSIGDLETKVESLASSLIRESSIIPASSSIDFTEPAKALIRKAREVVTNRYAENRHQIGAALLSSDGRVFTGLHVEAMVGRASVCAEAIALGKACEAGVTSIHLTVSVRHPKPSEANREIRIVPPCGLCRELLMDYGKDAKVILEVDGRLVTMSLAEMLPHKYVGTKWPRIDQSKPV